MLLNLGQQLPISLTWLASVPVLTDHVGNYDGELANTICQVLYAQLPYVNVWRHHITNEALFPSENNWISQLLKHLMLDMVSHLNTKCRWSGEKTLINTGGLQKRGLVWSSCARSMPATSPPSLPAVAFRHMWTSTAVLRPAVESAAGIYRQKAVLVDSSSSS